ncbi:MAG: IMS domain-containing protein [Leptolyngbyaceae cyanobacterium bins.59]|nr:IMS domain-containing protein [Leptolyngbyaceae cyanobacterium bins.59]
MGQIRYHGLANSEPLYCLLLGKRTVRIPLDYYRILGLPVQATAEHIQQAYRDRSLQLPRRGYSEAAIASRRQLIDEAYAVLSTPEKRQAYDEQFWTRSVDGLSLASASVLEDEDEKAAENQPIDLPSFPGTLLNGSSIVAKEPQQVPSIEIEDGQLVGALLILLELGEYNLVLQVSQSVLKQSPVSFQNGQPEVTNLVRVDVILTFALASLELGREQWQQGQYENAAASLNLGQDLLLREGVFAGLRGEIQSDLYKLRPYRILELLSLPEVEVAERQKGLQLLKEALQERGGIDGAKKDQSGLSIDDFLRFIQQLRSYLTVAEQQALFEEEARRPSAVATYLAVYALIARGFAEYQPSLIRRAKHLLTRLNSRQDVHLENAVCALLLGQTQEASQSLALSQEQESIAFIEENSQGSPDLLPGLCLYSERWLEEEVFPHFRDLMSRCVSLKGYFADEQVQAYLEELPEEPGMAQEWAVISQARSGLQRVQPAESESTRSSRSGAVSRLQPVQESASISIADRGGNGRVAAPSESLVGATLGSPSSRTPVADRPPSQYPSGKRSALSEDSRPTGRGRSRPTTPDPKLGMGQGRGSSIAYPDASPGTDAPEGTRRSGGTSRSPKIGRIVLLSALVLGCLGGLGYLAVQSYGWLMQGEPGQSTVALEADQPAIKLDQSPVTIPDPETSNPLTKEGPLDQEMAQQVVQAWLTAKSEALGSDYQDQGLSQILVEPLLTRWQKRVEEAKNDGWHWKYKHSFEVKKVQPNPSDENQAIVEAAVNEAAELYEGAQLNQEASYNTDLMVRYTVKRHEGQWRIREIAVFK